MRLAGLHEIAAQHGVSRQLAYKWTQRLDFPPPVAALAMGKVWDADAVKRWGRRKSTPPR